MKSLTYPQLKSFSAWLQMQLEGSQLQEVWTYDQGLILQFYKFKELHLWIEANSVTPMICLLEKKPPFSKKQKPISPFLNSNAKNMRFYKSDVEMLKGRVITLLMAHSQAECEIEIQLIPKAFNIIARIGEKKISWNKPRELPASVVPIDGGGAGDQIQDWLAFGREHLSQVLQPTKKSAGTKEDLRPRAIEKKEKAILEMQAALNEDKAILWQEFGEHLKSSKEIPEKFSSLYKKSLSAAENRENAFHQAKLLKKKKAGTLERIEVLKQEVEKLKKDLAEIPFGMVSEAKESLGQKIMQKSESKGRRLTLSDQMDAVMGKTAKDNLALLRRAQPTDLWLHLKDEPSAHVIIVKPKNLEVPQNLIQKASEWLVNEMFSKKKERFGGRVEVIAVECRHVRPIKGDKHGRVTYHNARTYRFTF